jgi:hypothetical protein
MAAAAEATQAMVELPDLTAFQAWAPHVRRFSYLPPPTGGANSWVRDGVQPPPVRDDRN